MTMQSTGRRSHVQPMTVRTGAEISGVNLADVDDETIGLIRQALLAHRVVFFRDQDIGAAEHIASRPSWAHSPGAIPPFLSSPAMPRSTTLTRWPGRRQTIGTLTSRS